MTRQAWADAFLTQGKADWEAYVRMQDSKTLPTFPVCHGLHFLQMACEKIAKAYRIRDLEPEPEELMRSHVAVSKFIGPFLRSATVSEDYRGNRAHQEAVIRSAKSVAREIERLAPAIDRVGTPENAEYPWEAGDDVVAPCSYTFPHLSLLTQPGGRAFLSFMERARDEFDKVRIR